MSSKNGFGHILLVQGMEINSGLDISLLVVAALWYECLHLAVMRFEQLTIDNWAPIILNNFEIHGIDFD